MRVLEAYEGEALALVYSAYVNGLNPLSFAVMETELLKCILTPKSAIWRPNKNF